MEFSTQGHLNFSVSACHRRWTWPNSTSTFRTSPRIRFSKVGSDTRRSSPSTTSIRQAAKRSQSQRRGCSRKIFMILSGTGRRSGWSSYRTGCFSLQTYMSSCTRWAVRNLPRQFSPSTSCLGSKGWSNKRTKEASLSSPQGDWPCKTSPYC